jgi:hypothetical protein
MELAAAELLADVASSMVKNQERDKSMQNTTSMKSTSPSEFSSNTPGQTLINNVLGKKLQIVNPERLDCVSLPNESNAPPSTPWESSLTELVRYVESSCFVF